MNSRIKKIAEQAGYKDLTTVRLAFEGFHPEIFATLLITECAEVGLDSVEDGDDLDVIMKRVHDNILKHFEVDVQVVETPKPALAELKRDVDVAYNLGAKGSSAAESERLLFESWMRGHCWRVGGQWDGKQYVADTENCNNVIDPQAMLTRQLWAAWRDRAALVKLIKPGQNFDEVLSPKVQPQSKRPTF